MSRDPAGTDPRWEVLRMAARDDCQATAPTFPPWFQSRLIEDVQETLAQPITGPRSPIGDLVDGFLALRRHFWHVLDRYTKMLRHALAPRDDDLWKQANQALEMAERVLRRLPWIEIGVEENERGVFLVRQSVLAVETVIVASEFRLLEYGDHDLAYMSRFERARLRYKFKQLLTRLQAPQLRDADYENDVLSSMELEELPVLEIQHAVDDDFCPICRCEVEDEDVSMVATHWCCKKAFHANCLLPWLLAPHNQARSCPHCRQPGDLEFIGQVLEVSTRTLKIL
ncbi:hypothetical protein H2200_012782 [Cladophialophora chaetospira]|uniref:RING-type domain-containing protein n=1 Tax=Cladophialophora chaetospira TaxID=386627 RepID=A0AA38WWT6_9EURO|nr:hypothetical protein H2200_012782 [Cladophialophora chaetospira]